MAKLTKEQAKKHKEACELLKKDVLTFSDKEFVLEHWNESATHMNGVAGAFFTPPDLADAMSIEVNAGRIIDLCAGIGTLAYSCKVAHEHHRRMGPEGEPVHGSEFVCVEMNPDYVAVGKKIMPEATWICGSVFDLPADIGRFDMAIGNPPFGSTPRTVASTASLGKYTGRSFEYHVIEAASRLARDGVFIIPAESATFRYSGRQGFKSEMTDECRKFMTQTGIRLEPNCGIDTSFAKNMWKGVKPNVEIVTVDFKEPFDGSD